MKGLRLRASSDSLEYVTQALRVGKVPARAHDLEQSFRIQQRSQIHQNGRDVIQMAGGFREAHQVHGRRLRGGHAHSARRRLHVLHRGVRNTLVDEESNPRAADLQGSDRPIGENLELLRLLVGRTMNAGRTEQSDIVGSLHRLHQVGYKPGRGRSAGM